MQPEPVTLLAAAREYVACYLPVIALSGKAPNGAVHRHGLNEPLIHDDDTLQAAMEHPVTTGVGIVIPFPYLVVDIDGEEGAVAYRDLVGERDFIPDRWVAKTGRGLHIWYARMEPTSSAKIAKSLDLKGQRSYVVAPPSVHPDGGVYEWLLPPVPGKPPLELPVGLDRWLALRSSGKVTVVSRVRMRNLTQQGGFANGTLSPTGDWTGVLKGMANADEGNRNNYLFWAASTMAELGASDAHLDELYVAATGAGLLDDEVRRTIFSARRAMNDARR